MESCVPREGIDRLLSGAASADEGQSVLAHVGLCPDCRRRFESQVAWRAQAVSASLDLDLSAGRRRAGDPRRSGRNIIVLLIVISAALHLSSRPSERPASPAPDAVVVVSPLGVLGHRPRVVEVRHPLGTKELILEVVAGDGVVFTERHPADAGDRTVLPFPDRARLPYQDGLEVRVRECAGR